MRQAGAALFIDPYTHHYEGDRLFDVSSASHAGDNILGTWIHLRERLGEQGIPVHTADLLESGEVDPAATNVYVSTGVRSRYERLAMRPDTILSAFFAFECPIVEPSLYLDLDDASRRFRRMYSFSTGDALRPFLRAPLEFRQFRLPYPYDRVHEGVWQRTDRRFMVMINANKLPRLPTRELYTERMHAVEYFGGLGEIDLFGVGWDGPPFRVGETRVPRRIRNALHRGRARWESVVPSRNPLLVAARAAYRGTSVSKAETLGSYTFAICFENMVLDGWVTEKIFDCFLAGTVPVYLGAPDIERWVPPECFVDMRAFSDLGELRSYLLALSPAEVEAYREAARDYIGSDRFFPFSKHAFAELLGSLVAEDAAGSL